jgi:hypothetical protein
MGEGGGGEAGGWGQDERLQICGCGPLALGGVENPPCQPSPQPLENALCGQSASHPLPIATRRPSTMPALMRPSLRAASRPVGSSRRCALRPVIAPLQRARCVLVRAANDEGFESHYKPEEFGLVRRGCSIGEGKPRPPARLREPLHACHRPPRCPRRPLESS